MSAPLRVVLAIETSGPGGAEQVVLQLARALRERGDAPHLATLRPGWMTERAEAAGIPVWIAPQRPGLDPLWIPRFSARLRRERIGLVHSHEFAMNVYAGAAAAAARRRSVATLHGSLWATERGRRALAYRVLRRCGMRIVAVSDRLARSLAPGLGLPPDVIDVIHNGVPIPERLAPGARASARAAARAALGVPPEGPLLVAIGNLYPVKDHATLVRAAARLPGVRAAIAGRGEEEAALRRLATELGVSERLHLLGLRDDVERVRLAADVFVQPSRSEGLPLAILEAMAVELPIVATRVGGVGEALIDGVCGRLVPPGDPEALARALREVLESPDAGRALGAAAGARAREEFSVERMVGRYRALYTELLGAHAGAAP